MSLPSLIEKLKSGVELDFPEITESCSGLLDESVPVPIRADFLRALNRKGETPAEIAGFARTFLELAVRPALPALPAVDVCGTGGDRLGLFNISTAAMFVAAGAGARVVKHGNRGITSRSGGADVLEALGVRIDLPPERAGDALEAAGCCFLFAPLYHPAFKLVAPVRKQLASEGSPSVFNLLGPLLNPARPLFQLTGVFNPDLLDAYAATFRLLGRQRAWAVHGLAGAVGMDEVSTLGPTRVHEADGSGQRAFDIDPTGMGFAPASLDDLRGSDAEGNALLITQILAGEGPRPTRDIVALNAACALAVSGIADGIPEALAAARESITSGAARAALEALRSVK